MAITRKRARASSQTEEANPPTAPPTKKIKIILHCKPPTPPQPQPPTPLPLQHFLSRGIVPLLASHPNLRFKHSHPCNLQATTRHATSHGVRRVLRTLIKSGRRFRGSTPGITMKARKGEKKVRYEYWPVFDECVDEDEWKASLLRVETPMGKPMAEEVEMDLRGYFFKPACIDESIDFEI